MPVKGTLYVLIARYLGLIVLQSEAFLMVVGEEVLHLQYDALRGKESGHHSFLNPSYSPA